MNKFELKKYYKGQNEDQGRKEMEEDIASMVDWGWNVYGITSGTERKGNEGFLGQGIQKRDYWEVLFGRNFDD